MNGRNNRNNRSGKSVAVASQRFIFSTIACVLASAMVLVGLPAVTANAAGSIPVTYEEVEAKSDSAIEGADFCDFSSAASIISGYDQDTAIPGDVSASNGKQCSFVSAYYVYQDANPENNVSMKLEKIETQTIGDKQYAILTPEVSEGAKVSQKRVSLTIPIDSLGKKNNDKYRIVLHYADTSTFRRIALSLAPESTGTGDNAQPDINMDGTQLTGVRRVFLYKDTSDPSGSRFVRNVSIDVPRLHTIEWSSNSADIEFKEVNDTSFVQTDGNGDVTTDKNGSVVGRTERQYDIVYQSRVSNANVKLQGVVSTAPLTKVTMRADTGGVDYGILKDIGEPINEEYGFLNYDNLEQPAARGSTEAQGRFRDGMLRPFFYKVTSTQGEQLNPNSNFKDLFTRTGIPVKSRTADHSTWADVFYKSGKACGSVCWASHRSWWGDVENKYFDNWDSTWHEPVNSPRLLDTTFIAPYPTSGDLQYNGPDKSKKGDTWFTDSRIVDVQNESDPTWPAADVNWNNSNIPVNQNIAGKDSEVSFYVQFNGLPSKTLTNVNSKARWSYFLGRIMINDEWYAVPFPNFPKTPVKAIPSKQGCYVFGVPSKPSRTDFKDQDNNAFESFCGTYTNARSAMFTSPDNPNKEPDTTITDVSSDYFTDNAGTGYVYSVLGLSDTKYDPTSKTSKGQVYVPIKLAESNINSGKNAGARVTVELVNARSQADVLGDGFSRYTSSGKTTGRNYRHAPSPRLGPATQLTNITTSDRGPMDCSVEDDHYCPRNDLMANQWKTLYKVTVKGMMTKDLNVSMVYDYTNKPVLWNAGSAPASKVEVKESGVYRDHPDFSKAMSWRDRSRSKEDDATCVANGLAAGWNRYGKWDAQHGVKCSTIVAEDMANDQEAGNDGNIHFVLKDGYKDPQLWTYYNRTQWAPCDDSRNNACTFKHKSSGQWWYQWNYADVDAFNRDGESGKIPTATATAFKIDADTIKTPLVVMKNSESNAKATDETAADSRVAPDQWRMQNEQNTFAAPTVDKAANYYIKLNGDVPDPQDGKAFTGYKLQGITAGGQVEQLMSNRTFYPGDAIDLRDVDDSGAPLVKLSNDAYDGARYAELQLVPTFGATSKGMPKLYQGQKFLKKSTGDVPTGDPFYFYAAPGLYAGSTDTVSDDEGSNLPKTITDGGITYTYKNTVDSNTLNKAIDPDTIQAVKFMYEPPEPTNVRVNLQFKYIDADTNQEMNVPASAQKSNSIQVKLYFDQKAQNSANKKNNLDWYEEKFGEDYQYYQGSKLKFSYNVGTISPEAIGCTPDPVKSTIERTDKGKETEPSTLVARDKTSDTTNPHEYTIDALDAAANTYKLTLTMSCRQSIMIYSKGDEAAFRNSGTVKMPDLAGSQKGVAKVNGPEDYVKDGTPTNDAGAGTMTSSERRAWLLEQIKNYTDDKGEKPYKDGWQPFHKQYDSKDREGKKFKANVKNGILPAHKEPGDGTATPGIEVADNDNHFMFWAHPAGATNREQDKSVGARDPKWLAAQEYKPELTNHRSWYFDYDCPTAMRGDSSAALPAILQPGQNVVCYVEFHTSELTILAEGTDAAKQAFAVHTQNANSGKIDSSIDFGVDKSVIDAAPGDKKTGYKEGPLTSVVEQNNTRHIYPSAVAVNAYQKDGTTGTYFEPQYYLYTGNDPNNANVSDSSQWEKLATAEQVKTWYGGRYDEQIRPNTLFRVKSWITHTVRDFKDVNKTPDKPEDDIPAAFSTTADEHSVIKVKFVEPVSPNLPRTGGSAATTFLIIGAAVLTGGVLSVVFNERRRKSLAGEVE